MASAREELEKKLAEAEIKATSLEGLLNDSVKGTEAKDVGCSYLA